MKKIVYLYNNENKGMLFFLTASLLFFYLLLIPCESAATADGEVKDIIIKGNNRIDIETIRYYIHTKIGDIYTKETIREDIKRIYKIGHFDDVRVESKRCDDGLCLIYIVVEKPSIHAVLIKGNDDVSKEDIQSKILIKKGEALNRSLIKETEEKINALYNEKGFYFAEISYKVEPSQNNQVDVIFMIKEREKIKIKTIKFIGNNNFSAGKLKRRLKTKEKGIFSFLTGSGIYKKEVLKTDILRLEAFYQDNGYARVNIYDPVVKINKEENRIDITITVKEGPLFSVRSINITGDDTFSKDELFSKIELKTDDIFNRSLLREDIFRINKLYAQKGYAYADVVPVIDIIDEEKMVDITLEINRARKYYVGIITIKGNHKTRDRVIRREFRLHEGEVFDSWKIERTRERIFNLGFFNSVNLDTSRGDEDDLLDITVEVEERSTGQFSVSAGYSSVEKFVFSSQVSFSNLFGRGQKLSLTAERSSIRNQFIIDFLEPWVMDREISAGFDLFYKDLNNDTNTDSSSYGGGLRLGRSLGEYTRGSMKYRFKYLDIYRVKNPTKFNKEGIVKISSLSPRIVRDTRDNIFNPTKGSKVILSSEYAGGSILGGENFYNLNAEGSVYFPLVWKFVGMVHSRFGFSEPFGDTDAIPITERYFLDGLSGMRGYNIRDIGPRDGEGALGGNKLLLFNVELHFPVTDAFRIFTFYDRGNVYGQGDTDLANKEHRALIDDDYSLINMRHSYGFGIRFFTPIGPLGLSYGIKLDTIRGEDPGELHFNIGGTF